MCVENTMESTKILLKSTPELSKFQNTRPIFFLKTVFLYISNNWKIKFKNQYH